MQMDNETMPQLVLPGFRFHPTEEELLNFYLKKIVMGKTLRYDIIGVLNIYNHDPSELPGLAKIGEREWYFFVPRDRRHGHGGRPNRTTKKGFWKATGSDRHIRCLLDPKTVLGIKKTLVFYRGRAPRGSRTDWVMNEYRLPGDCYLPKEDIVLCKIYRKATSMKVLEERAAMEEETRITHPTPSSPLSQDTLCSHNPQENYATPKLPLHNGFLKTEEEQDYYDSNAVSSSSVKDNLRELEVPKFSLDMMSVDTLSTPLRSPWLDTWSPNANMLNF